MTRLTLAALHEAFLFTCGSFEDDHAAYVCRRTGDIHWVTSEIGPDEVPKDIDDPELYALVPDQHALDLGKPLIFDFVAEEAPHLHDRIAGLFRSPGAYRRFKDLLQREGKLESWYSHEAERQDQALRAWCEVEGFELTEDQETG